MADDPEVPDIPTEGYRERRQLDERREEDRRDTDRRRDERRERERRRIDDILDRNWPLPGD